MFRPIDKYHWVNPTTATHIALPPKTVSALRDMIYKSPHGVWNSRRSFTAHLKRIDIPSTVHGALYRLMAAEPDKERVTCVDLVDIDLLFDGHLSLFVAAATEGRERQSHDALRSAFNRSVVNPTGCGVVYSATSESFSLNKMYEALDDLGSFDQFQDANICCAITSVFDNEPPKCAHRIELWVASESGAKVWRA